MRFVISKRFLALSVVMAFASFIDLYIYTNPIMGLVQPLIWIVMGVVAAFYERGSSVLVKVARFIAGVLIGVGIGAIFFEASKYFA